VAVVEINKANMKRSSMAILGCDFGSRISDSCVRFGLPFWYSPARGLYELQEQIWARKSGECHFGGMHTENTDRMYWTTRTVLYDDATGASTVLERICELFCT
jgi:hypothetical protein